MPTARPAAFDRRFARQLWSLVRLYWRSSDAKWGALLLSLAIALELGAVWGNVLLSYAQREILDALAAKNAFGFFTTIGLFLGLVSVFLLVSTYRTFVRQMLEIRWRRWLTAHYVERWMGDLAFHQTVLHNEEADNPDQRIAEDVRDFVASALGLSLSLLSALATLVSFGGILWRLSGSWPIELAGATVHVPGLMLWVALVYALLAMWVTHLVGRRLVPINFDRRRVEADFRYGLVRFRDHTEAVALAGGQALERRGALDRFGHVVTNWWQLIRAERNLNLLTLGIGQANDLVPLLVAVPAYFAGHLTLGSIAQTRIAYGSVSASLTWFVSAYQEIARWRASIERLSTLAEVMDATTRDVAAAERIRLSRGEGETLRFSDLRLALPDGRVVLDAASAHIRAGERIAVVGPSGTGKTTLFRAIAGIWPFGSGRIEVPLREGMLFLPQQPYAPLGSLRAAVCYPAPEDAFPDERVREALRLLALGHLEPRLEQVEHWEQKLSAHELQRVALARALLHEPAWVFLDEATSALDEAMEARVYALLAERLPHAAVVSVAHRPGVIAHHDRRWDLSAGPDGRAVLEAA